MTMLAFEEFNMRAKSISIYPMKREEAKEYASRVYPTIMNKKEREEYGKELGKKIQNPLPNTCIFTIKDEKIVIGMMVVIKCYDIVQIKMISVPSNNKWVRNRDDIMKYFLRYCKENGFVSYEIISDSNEFVRYYFERGYGPGIKGL